MASIRKREWTSKAGPQTAWVVDYLDNEGKRRLKTFDKKKDADAWLVQARHQVSQGTHTPDSISITVKEAGELWVDQNKLDSLERSTIEQRESHLRLHINPRIGSMKLSKLTAPSVKEFANDLLRELTRPMAAKVLRSLRMLLTHAMRAGKVAQNAATAVKIDLRQREDDEVTIPAKRELNAILAAAPGRWRPLFVTAAFTGMRASELRGLTWGAIDFDKRMIRVTARADKWGDMGAPKSRTSRRDIPLTPMVAAALKEWQKECPPGSAGLVFPNTLGNVEMHTNIVRRGWIPTLMKAGVYDRSGEVTKSEDGDEFCELRPAHGFHSLRHFYASWVIEQGFLPKRVQALLGHSSIQMTFDTYGHLFPSADDDHAKLAAAETTLLRAV